MELNALMVPLSEYVDARSILEKCDHSSRVLLTQHYLMDLNIAEMSTLHSSYASVIKSRLYRALLRAKLVATKTHNNGKN